MTVRRAKAQISLDVPKVFALYFLSARHGPRRVEAQILMLVILMLTKSKIIRKFHFIAFYCLNVKNTVLLFLCYVSCSFPLVSLIMCIREYACD